jgi:hypothetical protein
MKNPAYPAFQLSLTALGGIVGLASNPDYYAYALISVAICAAAWSILRSPANRKLLLSAFVTLGFLSFIIGRIYFRDHHLDENGIFLLILFGLLPVGIVSLCILSNERVFLEKANEPVA